jgi:peptide/nickel transport system substrate-binding protein
MVAAVALVAAACGSSSGTGQNPGPKTGGTLTMALDGDIQYADPALVSDANSLYVANQVVEGLVGIAPGTTSTIVPVLASALPTVGADGLTYTFKLRTGIKFHDGTDFNAGAVKANYDRWRNFPAGDLQAHAYYYAAVFGGFGLASNVASVDAPDPATVVIHLAKPQSNFLITQTVAAFGIQSPAAINANDGNDSKLSKNIYALGTAGKGAAMVGTGPFIFSEWKPGNHVTLVKNPDYWNATGRAYVNQIVFKPYTDPEHELSALQGGQADMVETLVPNGVKKIRSDSGYTVYDRGSGCNITQLGMNNQLAAGNPNALGDSGVRFAVASAMDKAAYINGYYSGLASVADNWLPAGIQYYKREYLPGYDITSARGSLAQSGQLNPALDLWYPTGAPETMFPDAKGLALSIAADLQAAGFTINVKSEAYSPSYLADMAGGKLPLFLQSQACLWPASDGFLYTSFFGYRKGAPAPAYAYQNDALNALMLQALSDATDAAAKADWQKANDMIAADMPTVPILSAKLPAGAKRYVMGFVGAGNRNEILNTVWLNK